eukprot:CAMPEP_0206463328 /NCGR_PEP_ID=MMETSP0324_2-20121206/26532_1 /ASSEMBLY_ACC=CAM_ASM_000836 /TAXON_ID=2866 /ORGANISM="Crypthecodinium cohnii, Strain Seligo" /LENGTH=101 /DNA_ID=CAMNT_0053935701 /DNA_START=30 /DNA_END=335 /DNA_ORIENTATION=+
MKVGTQKESGPTQHVLELQHSVRKAWGLAKNRGRRRERSSLTLRRSTKVMHAWNLDRWAKRVAISSNRELPATKREQSDATQRAKCFCLAQKGADGMASAS